MSTSRIYWLHALSPTHAGIGQGVGYIDQPIDRDKVTGWPVIRGSTFKGVWADYYKATDENRLPHSELALAFGRAGNDSSNAGSLIPTDARLVCLPVRSFRGTFAYCTSPLVLQMLRRTLELAGVSDLPSARLDLEETKAHHAQETSLAEEDRIFLEDLDFTAQPCHIAADWANKLSKWIFPDDSDWQGHFTKRFAVLPHSAFDFLCETGTEVQTRVRIDDTTKTVSDGALWTEEALPAETILAGLIQCDRVFNNNGKEMTSDGLLDRFAKDPLSLQIGGNATIGRGQMRCVFTVPNGTKSKNGGDS